MRSFHRTGRGGCLIRQIQQDAKGPPNFDFMKKNTTQFLACVMAAALLVVSGRDCGAQTNQPKRLLGVTVAVEYRHASIETGEKNLEGVAKKDGGFTVEPGATEAGGGSKMTAPALEKY